MNLIKNFFHAFGDIIFGIFVVGIAVFLIGTQVNDDFHMMDIGAKSYNSILTKLTNKTETDKSTNDESNNAPSEILSEPADAKYEKNNTTSSDDTNTSTNNQVINSNKAISETPSIRTIEISYGSTAEEVASGLFANGIIASKEEFFAEYARLPVGRTIVGGKFEIPAGSAPAHILEIIAPE
ncbi:MAG: hypothetical protein ACRDA4_00680 [Filifactoraceae bacterium]